MLNMIQSMVEISRLRCVATSLLAGLVLMATESVAHLAATLFVNNVKNEMGVVIWPYLVLN